MTPTPAPPSVPDEWKRRRTRVAVAESPDCGVGGLMDVSTRPFCSVPELRTVLSAVLSFALGRPLALLQRSKVPPSLWMKMASAHVAAEICTSMM